MSMEAARIWYAKAAAQGFQDSQNVLGVFYARGQGGPKSLEHAIFWWTYTADKQECSRSNAHNFQMLKSDCFACGRSERSLGDGKKMQRCEMCECAFYCDKECQLAAWREGGHDAACKKIQALRVEMFEASIEVEEGDDEDEDHATDVEGAAGESTSAAGGAKTGSAAASTPAASAAASKEEEESSADVCSICLEILPKWAVDFERYPCCGKGLHYECAIQLRQSACGDNCPMCRSRIPNSTEEHIIQCLPWANKGKVWAMHKVGQHYREAQSLETSRLWLEKAAELGLAEAQFELGLSHHGVGGHTVSMEKARFWFERAAEQGYPNAQYNLGQMQLEGRGGPVLMENARCWFEKAAEAENSEAQFELAYMHSHGGRAHRVEGKSTTLVRKVGMPRGCSLCRGTEQPRSPACPWAGRTQVR